MSLLFPLLGQTLLWTWATCHGLSQSSRRDRVCKWLRHRLSVASDPFVVQLSQHSERRAETENVVGWSVAAPLAVVLPLSVSVVIPLLLVDTHVSPLALRLSYLKSILGFGHTRRGSRLIGARLVSLARWGLPHVEIDGR